MLDLFTILSKGGIVLWCFEGTSQLFAPSVNALIRTVLLQERTGSNTFGYDGLTLQYKLDNEFELVFVVAYQKILQLSYIDKFLDCIHLEFRDKYKDDLLEGNTIGNFSFADEFTRVLRSVEEMSKRKAKAPKKMKTYEQSVKSQKTVASMIERKDDVKSAPKPTKEVSKKPVAMAAAPLAANGGSPPSEQDQILINRMKFFEKQQPRPKPKEKALSDKKSPKANAVETKKSKQARQWEHGGTNKDIHVLDFSNKEQQQNGTENNLENITAERVRLVGKMKGEIKGMEVESDEEEEEEEVQEEEVVKEVTVKGSPSKGASTAKGQPAAGFGMFNVFKSLVGSKVISDEDMRPVLDRMRDHLIGKNVAIDIADQLCQSVGKKLEGKVLGTFSGVASTVRASLTEACMQILLPQRRVDILRDVMEAQRTRRPYTVTFCGVNGVGKSTNLAKVTFWLVENGFRVLIAACDTFRAGAVEQLRTHTRHLNALHPPDTHAGVQMVQLYEKGYGKDAAGIAMEAINYAKDTHIDVVLVDTAGRMQDNEPLMRSLAKLIRVNQPDLVLFVGEALVGNEAVDQLVKFNQALADHSSAASPRLIDGIVLTKFDTIDDKVGAAISMTYSTGQPIVFVGTGQTYTDLKSLNAKAVVHALMKA